MKAGHYMRLAVTRPEAIDDYRRGEATPSFRYLGVSSDETYAERDALSEVANGKADEVVIVKVIGVAKRSARVEK